MVFDDTEHADNYAKEGDLRNLKGVPQIYRVELSPHRTIEIDNSRDAIAEASRICAELDCNYLMTR